MLLKYSQDPIQSVLEVFHYWLALSNHCLILGFSVLLTTFQTSTLALYSSNSELFAFLKYPHIISLCSNSYNSFSSVSQKRKKKSYTIGIGRSAPHHSLSFLNPHSTSLPLSSLQAYLPRSLLLWHIRLHLLFFQSGIPFFWTPACLAPTSPSVCSNITFLDKLSLNTP